MTRKTSPGLDIIDAVDVDAILHRDAEIRQKNRQGALVLRHGAALMIDDADAVVLHFVDHHVVGGFLEDGRHLVRRRLERAADDFGRDWINSHKLSPEIKAQLSAGLFVVASDIRLAVGLDRFAAQLVQKLNHAFVAHMFRFIIVIVVNDLFQRPAHAFRRLDRRIPIGMIR